MGSRTATPTSSSASASISTSSPVATAAAAAAATAAASRSDVDPSLPMGAGSSTGGVRARTDSAGVKVAAAVDASPRTDGLDPPRCLAQVGYPSRSDQKDSGAGSEPPPSDAARTAAFFARAQAVRGQMGTTTESSIAKRDRQRAALAKIGADESLMESWRREQEEQLARDVSGSKI